MEKEGDVFFLLQDHVLESEDGKMDVEVGCKYMK